MNRQWGNAFVGMHAHRCGVQNGIKGLPAERAARNGFPADRASQLFRSVFSPGANAHYRAGSCQGKGSAPRRAARPENQHATVLDAHVAFERTKHAEVVRVAAVERAITPDYYGVYRANFRRQRLAFFQMFEDGLFVRNSDAESLDSKVRDRF